jgi:hypothetical protein
MNKLILAILFLNMACHEPKDTENCHYSIKFKNNTDKALFINSSSDTILQGYMDPRMYPEDTNVPPYAGNDKVKIGEIRFVRNGKPMCIENLYKSDEKLYIFIYDSIELGNKDWNEVKKNYMVTKRYDYTFNELQKNNFTINYNGEKGYGVKNIEK